MWMKKIVDSLGRRRAVEDERWSERDVVRKLGEVEKKITDAIEDAAETNAVAILAATQAIVAAIQGAAPPEQPVAGKFTLLVGGIPMGAPVTVQIGLSGGTSTFVETSTTGAIVPGVSPTVYASDTPTVATIDTTGKWVVVGVGIANITAADPGTSPVISDTVVLTVTPVAVPVPVAGVFTLIPNAQARR
jgi:hypothetical protein